MTNSSAISRYLQRNPIFALTIYIIVMLCLITSVSLVVSDIVDRRDALARTLSLFDQLRGRAGRATSATTPERAGTPFLEGPTLTVAGATLLQRIGAAVSNVGGTIQSSQVDLLGPQAKDGFVGLVISCEVDQPALQKLLYDIESGMPFLFVDQLNIQSPQARATNDLGSEKIRVVLGVSGQWQSGK